MLLPGMPFIYYGDEHGMTGGEDPDCRRGMLWDEDKQDQEMFAYYKKLIQIRKEYPVLTEGKVTSCVCDDEKGTIVLERELGEEKAAITFSVKEYKVTLKVDCDEEVIFDMV